MDKLSTYRVYDQHLMKKLAFYGLTVAVCGP
jgi:hypothetical protein